MAFLPTSSRFGPLLFKRLPPRYLSSNVQQEASPLMVDDVLQQLNVRDGDRILDMTFGDGLHTEAILRSNESVSVIALDRDPCAFEKAKVLSLNYPGRLKPLLGRISDLPTLFKPLGINRNSFDGIIFDLGCSNMQLCDANRGFSPDLDGPLDMKMDGPEASDPISAHDIVMRADENDLKRILRIYGDKQQATNIAKAIVTCRYTMQSLNSTCKFRDFLKVVCEEKSNRVVRNVFYALRAFVNNELNELNHAMILSVEYLKTGGRVVSLTFNHVEDTIVKRHISGNVLENSPNRVPLKYYSVSLKLDSEEINALKHSPWSPTTKHVITPCQQDKAKSLRFQQAKLRGAVKL